MGEAEADGRIAVMRLGKPMEHLQAAVKAMAVADPILKITAIARQLGYALYLANDHLVWVYYNQTYSGETRLYCLLAALRKDQAVRQGPPRQDQLQRSPLLGSWYR